MRWVPIEQADKTHRDLLVWIPDIGPVSGAYWDSCQYHVKAKPYWTTDKERPMGVAWQRANQPTHFAVAVEPPESCVSHGLRLLQDQSVTVGKTGNDAIVACDTPEDAIAVWKFLESLAHKTSMTH